MKKSIKIQINILYPAEVTEGYVLWGKNDYNFVILSMNELFHCNGDLNDQYNLLNILYF